MKVIIAGGGVGGLTTALMLHERGIACEVYEAAPEVKPLGVGINVLPHAVSELVALGLLDELDRIAIRTRTLIYANRFGQEVWREKRGMDAGYAVPQFSIHRGHLQVMLRDAVVARLGADAIRPGHAFERFEEDEGGVTAYFRTADGGAVAARGDVLVGSDGIHSAVRRQLYPAEGGLRWNGTMMWRGAVEREPFLDGSTMIVAGGFTHKLVLYPIAPGSAPGRQLINWVVTYRQAEDGATAPRREDWNRRGTLEDVIPHAQMFSVEAIDLLGLIRSTPAFFEYPMCDRDPLPRWTHGRVTLLGDAAHPMYPVGSNGAGQAILDARALADALVCADHGRQALAHYEAQRLGMTADIVRINRRGGPEGVIDEVERRAPDGFSSLDDVISFEERKEIVTGYAKMAGFAKEQVNRKRA